jgi:hypothetical protein
MALVLVLSAGCQKLNYDRSVSLASSEVQSILIDAPKRDQKVTVAIASPGVPINAYLVLEQNKDAVQEKLLNQKKPDAGKILASVEKSQDGTLEATVPGGSSFAVVIGGAAKNTQVQVKVTGR